MAIWILQPDQSGTCCDCGGRQSPCDSCGPECRLHYSSFNLAGAQGILDTYFITTCFVYSLASSSGCSGGTIFPCVGGLDCTSDSEDIVTYTPDVVTISNSLSGNGDCSASAQAQAIFTCTVSAGTIIHIVYNLSGLAAGSSNSSATMTVLALFGSDTVVNDESNTGSTASLSGDILYTAETSDCFYFSYTASASSTWTGGGAQSASLNGSITISFSQTPVWYPVQVSYSSPSPGVLTCGA